MGDNVSNWRPSYSYLQIFLQSFGIVQKNTEVWKHADLYLYFCGVPKDIQMRGEGVTDKTL